MPVTAIMVARVIIVKIRGRYPSGFSQMLLVVLIFSISPLEAADKREIVYAELDDGRRLLPLSSFSAESGARVEFEHVRAEFDAVQKAFLRASRRGASSTTHIERSDGTLIDGRNEFFSGRKVRLREIRPGYSAVIVGGTICYLDPIELPTCGPVQIYLGLPEMAWEAVTRAEIRPGGCDERPCFQIELQENKVFSLDVEGAPRSFVDPHAYWSYRILVDAGSRRPISVETDEYRDGEFVAAAKETFDFDSGVSSINLPKVFKTMP